MPPGGDWTTPVLTVTLTMSAVFMAGLGIGAPSLLHDRRQQTRPVGIRRGRADGELTCRRDLAREFLGAGWKFPLQVNPTGGIARARYEQRVEESIYLILSTAKGERVMLRDFGCGIHDLVFAPQRFRGADDGGLRGA